MDLTFSHLLLYALEVLLVGGLAFVIFCAVTSFMRFQIMSKHAAEVRSGSVQETTNTFLVVVADRFLQRRSGPKTLALILFAPRDYSRCVAEGRTAMADEMARHVEQRLRGRCRREDVVAVADPGQLGVLLDAPKQHVPYIVERVAQAIEEQSLMIDGGVPLRVPVKAGWALVDGGVTTARALVDAARANLDAGENPAPPAKPATMTHHDAGDSAQKPGILDPLTEVLKQSHVPGSLQKFVALHLREGYSMSLLCIDVDYLKRYNSKYGTETGDRILKRLSLFLQRQTREEDLIGRSGDDEFVVAMAASVANAASAARRMVIRAKKTDDLAIGEGLRFTVSIGVAGFPDHGSASGELLDAARLALRGVKSRGRNNFGLPETSVKDKMAGGRQDGPEADIF